MGTASPQSSRRLTPLQIALLVGAGSLVLLLIVMFVRGGSPSPDAATGSAELAETPFLALAVLSFFAGVLGFVSPCTLPLLPAYFAVTFQSERKRVLVMTLAFMAGLASTFALFGALAGILGQALGIIGLSKFQLARIGGLVIIFFGVLSVLGKGFTGFQIGLPPQCFAVGVLCLWRHLWPGLDQLYRTGSGRYHNFGNECQSCCLGGQLAGLAPILGSMLLLIIFAMGLGVPLILVSTIFGRADRNSLFWRVLRGKGWEVSLLGRTLYLHSTSLVSGLIFIALGVLMISGRLTLLNNLFPDDLALRLAEVFAGIEEWLVSRLG